MKSKTERKIPIKIPNFSHFFGYSTKLSMSVNEFFFFQILVPKIRWNLKKKMDHHFFDYISVISSIWTMENDLLKSVGVASDPFDIGQIPIYSILSIGHGMNCIPTTSMSKLFVCPSFWAEERIKRELTAMMLFGQLLNVKMTTSMEQSTFFYEPRAKRNFVYVGTTFFETLW